VNASTLEELRRQVDQVIEREGVGNNIGVKI